MIKTLKEINILYYIYIYDANLYYLPNLSMYHIEKKYIQSQKNLETHRKHYGKPTRR
jgi:uncharacterized membrane protein